MSISTFHSEFTKDLESFVKTPIQIAPIPAWSPHAVAAPERHVHYGTDYNPDTILHVLQSHTATEMIESMLRIYMTSQLLESLQTIDPVKEQVWLFGYKWLSIYYNRLVEPNVTRSEFYRVYHDSFLSLLRTMLQVHPVHRVTFVQGLRQWCPESPILQEVPIVVPTGQMNAPVIREQAKSLTSADSSETAPGESVSPPSQCAVSVFPMGPTRRLVLARPSDSEERNKTRRNRRS
jgi:hypothetical protein